MSPTWTLRGKSGAFLLCLGRQDAGISTNFSYGELLSRCFREKKVVSLSETPAKLENTPCLYLLNPQGKCYCSNVMRTKDKGSLSTLPDGLPLSLPRP